MSEEKEQMYIIMNNTDGIQAYHDLVNKEQGDEFIKKFPERFAHQGGMYRTSYGERIPATEVELELIPCDVDDDDMDEDVKEQIENGEPF
jgi:hypothetical protein